MSTKKSVNTLKVRPTQFAIGMLEIEEKLKDLKKLDKEELKKLVRKTLIPVVLSPHGDYYLVDKHHFLFTCWSLGVKKVHVEIVEDLTGKKMSYNGFWKWMHKHAYFYPFCQFGQGPRNPLYLPNDIRGLADDPYRSLAWFVRKDGGYQNTDENFAEFQWAQFFRRRKILDREGRGGFFKAVKKAKKLALSPAARRLPGYKK